MSQALTLARPYARAAFAMAKDAGRLAPWSNMLGFAAHASAVPEVQSALTSPQVAADTVVDLLLPPGDSDPNFRRLLVVLADNHRLVLLPEISALYDEFKADAERVVRATVTSAQPLDAAELDKLRASLRQRFGQDVEVATAVDPALIGGAVIDAGDIVIDGSIRTKLARLGAALAN